MKLRIGIDVGGTFTDVTAFDEDAAALVAVRKYTSNPAQPATVMEDITRDLAADFGADAVSLILHGAGIDTMEFADGEGLREALGKRAPDLVFLNIALESSEAIECVLTLGRAG